MIQLTEIDALLCAAIRGESPSWPFESTDNQLQQVIERAEYQGVIGLLHESLATNGSGNWPQSIVEAIRSGARSLAMWELRHKQVIMDMVDALANAGIESLLFKGTALAYSLYPNPSTRMRGDTDLIVSESDRAKAIKLLTEHGFEYTQQAGELMAYQGCLSKLVPDGGNHTIDLHWKINNSEVLAKLFQFRELQTTAENLPELASNARSPDPVNALLIACMHRAVHKQSPYYVDGVAYYSGDRLIWLYDLHLLANIFSEADWQEFEQKAKLKGLAAICLEGLMGAKDRFGTNVPYALEQSLKICSAEPVSDYLKSGVFCRNWMNLKAQTSLPKKVQFLCEILFPPASYMREKYPFAKPNWLLWLYLRRIAKGFCKRLTSNRASE